MIFGLGYDSKLFQQKFCTLDPHIWKLTRLRPPPPQNETFDLTPVSKSRILPHNSTTALSSSDFNPLPKVQSRGSDRAGATDDFASGETSLPASYLLAPSSSSAHPQLRVSFIRFALVHQLRYLNMFTNHLHSFIMSPYCVALFGTVSCSTILVVYGASWCLLLVVKYDISTPQLIVGIRNTSWLESSLSFS
jgi:hypothetical protein